jgi:hypothetical protein
MISVNTKKRIVRETSAKYEYLGEDGEVKTADIRVQYYSSTTKELKEKYAEAEAKINAAKESGAPVVFWHTDELAARLAGLPDLVDEDTKKPFDITIEFLDALDPKNVRRIAEAIREDENPKSDGTENA